MADRRAAICRNTTETQIELTFNLDGSGRRDLQLPVPFLRHMLDLFAAHGNFDLKIEAQGDVDIDDHHTVEDLGIALGQAFRQAVGDKAGIRRYGSRFTPMDESLAHVALDLSGRSYLVFQAAFPRADVGTFQTELVEEFFRAFAGNAGVTLHIRVLYGTNTHHMIEAIFKAFGGALADAVARDLKRSGIPSTKGVL